MRIDHSAVGGWLTYAAAPTFAMMALATNALDHGPGYMICSAAHGSMLGGMVPMYALMSAFHSPPWLRLIFGRPAASGKHRADI